MSKYFKKNLHFFSTFCFSLLMISLSCVVSLSNITTSDLSYVNSQNFSLYILTSAKSQLENSAQTLAIDQVKNNGSGYVWKKDNYFYAVLSAYLNKNDAELVKNNYKEQEIETEIIEVEFPVISISNPLSTAESKSTLLSALYFFQSSFALLFDISISLETKIYDETSAFLEINKVHAKSDEIMKNFNIFFQNSSTSHILSLNQAITSLNENIEQLSNYEKVYKNQSLISLIKYKSLTIMDLYNDYLLSINL